MLYFEYTLIQCPACKKVVDFHFMHVSTLLGPPVVECRRCAAVAPTGRIEWWQMEEATKVRFFAISFLYMVLAYFFGGLSMNTALYAMRTARWRSDWGLQEPMFWFGGIAWVVLVIVIQEYRIGRSLKRKDEPEPKAMRQSFWTFQLNGQGKVALLMMFIPALCWVLGVIASNF